MTKIHCSVELQPGNCHTMTSLHSDDLVKPQAQAQLKGKETITVFDWNSIDVPVHIIWKPWMRAMRSVLLSPFLSDEGE